MDLAIIMGGAAGICAGLFILLIIHKVAMWRIKRRYEK